MSNNRSCKKYEGMIEDYIDCLLSDKKKRELEAHVAECEECRASLRFSLALIEMTRASAEKMPRELHDKIITQTQSGGKRKQILRRAALFAACTLIFVCSVAAWALLPGNQKSESPLPDGDEIVESTAAETLTSTDAEEAPEDVIESSPEKIESSPTPEKDEIASENAPAPESPKDEAVAPEETVASTSAESRVDVTTELPSAEALGKPSPDGEDITLALLIVSGLLAIASFVAFLISLSSVRKIPSKKDKE